MGVLPVVSTPIPITCSGLKPCTVRFASASAPRMVFRAGHVVGGMLPGQVGVARQDDPLSSGGVVPNRGGDLPAVGSVDDESAHRVGAVVESEGVMVHVLGGELSWQSGYSVWEFIPKV